MLFNILTVLTMATIWLKKDADEQSTILNLTMQINRKA
jgi:hypothetical protein